MSEAISTVHRNTNTYIYVYVISDIWERDISGCAARTREVRNTRSCFGSNIGEKKRKEKKREEKTRCENLFSRRVLHLGQYIALARCQS